MNQKNEQGLNYIVQAINNIVDPKVETLKYDKTYRAKVTTVVDTGIYKVEIAGDEYQLTYNGTLSVGDVVRVKAPLNNFSDIYIEAEPSTGGGGSGGTTDYTKLTNKPVLNTTATTAQATNASQIITGTITLHKVSKTGSYNDLNDKPSLNFVPNTQKGIANGVATLDTNAIVPTTQLPTDTVYDSNYTHIDVINNLTNTSTVDALSAAQGKALSDRVNANDTMIDTLQQDIIQTDDDVTKIKADYISKGEKAAANGIATLDENTKVYPVQLPVATVDTLGAIKIGKNLSITADGTLSSIGGGGSAVADTLPIGAVVEWYNTDIPTNWLICNGQAVSRIDYADLFKVLGTTYGEGDGSTTFNLPNISGKVSIGLDSNDSDFDMLGKTGGSKAHIPSGTVGEHTLTISEIPAHTHIYAKASTVTGSHTLTTNEIPSHTHTYAKVNETTGSHTLTIDEIPPHKHTTANIKGTQYQGTWSLSTAQYSERDINSDLVGSTGGGKGHTHTISTTNANSGSSGSGNGHTHTMSSSNTDTGSIGGGKSHSHSFTGISQDTMPPYITTYYIIKAKQKEIIVAEVVDTLSSESTIDALSANQGRILNNKIQDINTVEVSATEPTSSSVVLWIDTSET